MKYTYTVTSRYTAKEVHTTVRPEEAHKFVEFFTDRYIVIFDNRINKYCGNIHNEDQWEEWMDKLARDEAWKPLTSIEQLEAQKQLTELQEKKAKEVADRLARAEKAIAEKLRREANEMKEPKNDHWDAFADADVQMKDSKEISNIAKAVDPPHYQGYLEGKQWIEAMQYIPTFRDPEKFKAALELQVRKYMDRSGQKDNVLQEMLKALWYMKFLVAYMKAGNRPINVIDVDAILKS